MELSGVYFWRCMCACVSLIRRSFTHDDHARQVLYSFPRRVPLIYCSFTFPEKAKYQLEHLFHDWLIAKSCNILFSMSEV